MAKPHQKQIEKFEKTEKGTNATDAETVRVKRVETEKLLARANEAMLKLSKSFDRVMNDWKDLKTHIIGRTVCSPAIRLGAIQQSTGQRSATASRATFWAWCILAIPLRPSTNLNVVYTSEYKTSPEDFTLKCFPRDDTGWEFEFPSSPSTHGYHVRRIDTKPSLVRR